jgi:dTDP-4-dehydrorhamnose reductase
MDGKKKFLIFGANGLIGRAVSRQLQGKYEWWGTYNKRAEPGLKRADITSADDLREIFREIKPDYVVNGANLAGGVDFCESHPDLAEKFHLEANIIMGNQCKQYGSRFLLISTDYVFDGVNPPYREEDPPHPLNVYGRLKLEAEKWLTGNVDNYTIVRTTNVFGWDPASVTPNYMMNLYNTVKSGREFRAPSFLWGNPTYVGDLASAIIELCTTETNGVFHVVGSSFINRHEWAKKACAAFRLDEAKIIEVNKIPERMVPRPLKSNLYTQKFRKCCKTILRDVDEGLKAFVQEMNQES